MDPYLTPGNILESTCIWTHNDYNNFQTPITKNPTYKKKTMALTSSFPLDDFSDFNCHDDPFADFRISPDFFAPPPMLDFMDETVLFKDFGKKDETSLEINEINLNTEKKRSVEESDSSTLEQPPAKKFRIDNTVDVSSYENSGFMPLSDNTYPQQEYTVQPEYTAQYQPMVLDQPSSMSIDTSYGISHQVNPPSTMSIATANYTPNKMQLHEPASTVPQNAVYDTSLGSEEEYILSVYVQPKAKVVYRRIVKPSPVIRLTKNTNKNERLYLDVTLVRSDNYEPISCIKGGGPHPISNGECVFKKLQITQTSKSKNCKFLFRFQLLKHENNNYHPVGNVSIFSRSIEVFSHSNYISKESSTPPPPPMVSCIIPEYGSYVGGTRCVLLGVNFVESTKLRVSFGETIVAATYHEENTLIVHTPPCLGTSPVLIRATNDATHYCDSSLYFTYTQ
eukprot:TRINITY_DN7467_c0_g1_i1.p1 TRINITY_DN7467_c0_g1~~TRINITY_DN7467_c0_g1_i1.p1  ORF type:complete len:451 (-),score=71.96 TRINITY_DN7467_c0_g1_i1:40-1392(-)